MRVLFFLDKILPLLFWSLLMFSFDSVCVAILTALSAAIHEFGHLIAISSTKKLNLPKANVSGFRIKIRNMSYTEELVAAAGGPLVNIVLGVLLILFGTSSHFGTYVKTFGIINLLTALSNLIPIESYDGYKILFCAGALLFDDGVALEKWLMRISFLLSTIMCFLSLYLILKIGEGYWLFVVFFSVTLTSIVKQPRNNFREYERF